MPRRASAAPAKLTLRVNDLLFLNEYMANGRNGTRAYQKVHPNASYQTARRCASDVLTKPDVQAELARRVRYDGGITKEYVESSLLRYQQRADAHDDYVAGASICMDAAKLAGLLVDKHADVSAPPSLSEAQLREELARRGFVPVAAN